VGVLDGVAGFIESPRFYPYLTGRQHLEGLGLLDGGVSTTRIEDVLDVVNLAGRENDKVGGYSYGMRQRLGVAASLLRNPQLLVLDEPANGLDPAGTRLVHRVLTGLAASGAAVVLSSHRMDELAALCSEVTILATGRVTFSGPLSELAADELDYRLRTSDPALARRVAPELRVHADDAQALVLRATVPVLDEVVARLVGAGVGVRELAPVVAPLEAAFLALTEDA
jgi:ABC-2 type transport system ATP-binding protein